MADKKTLVEFKFGDGTYKVVAEVANDYKINKHLSCPKKYGMEAFYDAIALLFDGKDEEYAEAIGGMKRFTAFVDAALTAALAKN